MTRESLIFGAVGLAIGSVTGFITGYKLMEKKIEKKCQEKLDREVSQLHSEDYITKEDYEEALKKDKETYEQMLSELRYAADEEDISNNTESSTPDADNTETYEDDEVEITKEPPKKHKKPKVLGDNKFDEDDPDTDFQPKDIYYFKQSELLTDENGAPLDETDTIGNQLRQFGFMRGDGSSDDVWVRNYDQEIDYLVHRRACAIEDEFGEEQDE